MATTLNTVLTERRFRTSGAERRRHFAVSLVAHFAVAALFVLLPSLLAEPPEPFDYVAVTVVPPKALGTEEPPPPPPPKPEPKRETPPPPPPPEKKPEPKPEPEQPVLVQEKPKPKPAPPPPKPAPVKPAPPPPPTPAAPIPKRQGSPFGDPLGASTNEATLGVEDPNFTYGYYLDLIVGRISANWTRPVLGGDVKDARLYFRIGKDGTVKDLALRQSSGDDTFDQSALRAVESSSPLPPLPKGYKRDYLGINLVVK